MKTIGCIARYYHFQENKSNETREISYLAIDIIQGWGEAFLIRSVLIYQFQYLTFADRLYTIQFYSIDVNHMKI